MNRAEIIHSQFLARVSAEDFPEPLPTDNATSNQHTCSDAAVTLANAELVDIFDSQLMSRLLDIISRRLSNRKQSFYTIGSSGHEGNAVFGKVFRLNDLAFLHYRSCAFVIQRSKKLHGSTPLFDTMLSFVASSEDPVSGGRHKVLGSKKLYIPPQTSTIASHLPKAMGTAHAIGLYPKVAHNNVGIPDDSVVLCNFGDASANHSTALGAINAAAWAAYQHSPMPIVFICEDNGIGISTVTPNKWIEANFSSRPGLKYMSCNGLDIIDTFNATQLAVAYARKKRQPVFLHCKTVRLMGHAGSDIETSYRSNADIVASEEQDPLLHSARILCERSLMSGTDICEHYSALEQRIRRIGEEVITRPKLASVTDVMHSILPPQESFQAPPLAANSAQRHALFEKEQRHFDRPINMARHINVALADIMLQYPNAVICGEDVGKKGGVYGVTQGLFDKFGHSRVTNTLLDEQTVLGLAIGLAHSGFLPIPEIQYLAYVHNAEDQIRGEAATLSFFSKGQFTNPMVIRIAGLAYQKGFGGHFHNDNSFTVFRDIPGITVACPSNGSDAARMLRACVDLAQREQKVVIFLEPIALYMTTDLHNEGDGLWASQYQAPDINTIKYGEVNTVGEGKDLCILTYANGFYLSQQAVKNSDEKYDYHIRVVDMRWLHPLPKSAILKAVDGCKKILIVDECRRTGSVSEALITLLHEHNIHVPISRINAEDCFIPLGDAAKLILPSAESIRQHMITFMQEPSDSGTRYKRESKSHHLEKRHDEAAANAPTRTGS